MGKDHEIRCFDYVNHPYERVRDVLASDALTVFQNATQAAASRAESLASALRVQLAGVEVATDIDISVRQIDEHPRQVTSTESTRLEIEWKAAKRPRLFPIMRGDLLIYPLTPHETQLDFLGHYDPPLGALGDAMDALVGHRIADAAVHRLMSDVATYLRTALQEP